MSLPRHEPLDGQGNAPTGLQRFRDCLVRAERAGTLSGGGAFRLMVFWSRAREDGTLRGRRSGRDGYYDEEQLAQFVGVTRKTFRLWWKRWESAGWVASSRPKHLGRAERRLVLEGRGSD